MSREYTLAALQRARRKLDNLGHEPPVGPPVEFGILAVVFLVFAALWLSSTLVFLGRQDLAMGTWPVPVMFLAQSVMFAYFYVRWRPTKPEYVVRVWINAVMRRKWERVNRVTASSDRDGFPRRLPDNGGCVELPLSGVHDLEQYWREVRARFSLPVRFWQIHKPRAEWLGSELARVRFSLSAPKLNPQIATLFVLIAVGAMFGFMMYAPPDREGGTVVGTSAFYLLLVPLFLMPLIMWRWRVKHELVKTVVKVGDEWRVFSGEWQAPEDRDLRWHLATSARG